MSCQIPNNINARWGRACLYGNKAKRRFTIYEKRKKKTVTIDTHARKMFIFMVQRERFVEHIIKISKFIALPHTHDIYRRS